MRVQAHAKINLHLSVGDVREDGYHDLHTVFHSLALHDTLHFTPAQQSSLLVTGMGAQHVPTDDSNLVLQALRRMGMHFDVALHKGIPTAGGMAGGSADAAAALAAANVTRQWTQERVLGIAAELGSDVPFTYLGGTMIGTGRGEQLTRVLRPGTFHFALAFSRVGLSTPAVFAKLDEMRAAQPDLPRAGNSDAVVQAVISGDPKKLAPALANDLHAPAVALQPELAKILRVGDAAGALASMVSGSGPTTFFLCESAEHAEEVAGELSLHTPALATQSFHTGIEITQPSA